MKKECEEFPFPQGRKLGPFVPNRECGFSNGQRAPLPAVGEEDPKGYFVNEDERV